MIRSTKNETTKVTSRSVIGMSIETIASGAYSEKDYKTTPAGKATIIPSNENNKG